MSYQSNEKVCEIFESPYPTTLVHIGRRAGRLPEFIKYRNTAVHELERALVYRKQTDRQGTSYHIHQWGSLERMR